MTQGAGKPPGQQPGGSPASASAAAGGRAASEGSTPAGSAAAVPVQGGAVVAPVVRSARTTTKTVSTVRTSSAPQQAQAQAQASQLAAVQAAYRLSEQLAALESRARSAASVNELAFSIANETYGLLGFRQALVLRGDREGRLVAVSGLARPAEDSPYLVWLKRVWPWLRTQWDGAVQPGADGLAPVGAPSPAANVPPGSAVRTETASARATQAGALPTDAAAPADVPPGGVTPVGAPSPSGAAHGAAANAQAPARMAGPTTPGLRAGWFQPQGGLDGVPESLRDGWREWWTAGVYLLPLPSRDGKALGWAVFLCNEAPAAWQTQALTRLASTWRHAWEALGGPPRKGLWQRWRALGWPVKLMLLGVLAALLFLPVRQSALAPTEVVSLDARVVAAPIDGVIQTVHVRPNQAVSAGDPLFSLDDTTLRNRYEVARQSVAVADAELVAATQKAFHDPASQSELALLQGRSHERRAELAAVQAQLARVQVVAEHDGVAVYSDPDDWLGRPVSTGERIMLLADPANPGMLIHLPVADAIALEPGAAVKLFLTVRPLDPLAGQVIETSYQAVPSPDGIASYRLRAAFTEDAAERSRIGLRGTAKLYGEPVMLGYYLLRRPLASLREWTGW